jgi:hypothetical protein
MDACNTTPTQMNRQHQLILTNKILAGILLLIKKIRNENDYINLIKVFFLIYPLIILGYLSINQKNKLYV